MIVDTNVLVRLAVRDDRHQAEIAEVALSSSKVIAISLQTLCEFAWVLRQTYKFDHASIATAIRSLAAADTAFLDRSAVAAGLALLDAGGDFADGIIAYEGRRLGGTTFVSFDRKAVKLLQAQGKPAQLLT